MKLKKFELISDASLKLLIEEAHKKKCAVQFKAKGSSMQPFILDQDLITLYPYLHAQPSIGDIAAFTHPVTGKLLIHRIICKNRQFSFKGDNRFLKDGCVEQNKILGFVGKIQRGEKEYVFEPEKGNRIIVWLSIFNIIVAFVLMRKIFGILIALIRTEIKTKWSLI